MKLVPSLFMVLVITTAPSSAHADPSTCANPLNPTCHVVTADPVKGEFHGLIMVNGQPDVLATAAKSGTQPGCGDCVWTLVLMCRADSPDNPPSLQGCNGVGNTLHCRVNQASYRLYLTTDAETNTVVETLCLGGSDDVIPVGDIATADVDRYLRDVRPPALDLSFQPPGGALAGLATYFMARPPAALAPQQFGNNAQGITETITISPLHYRWSWGDTTGAQATDDAGGRYPDGTLTHTYAHGGRVHGTLTTQWGATYTITVAGQTYGPYTATGGVVPRTQDFSLTVSTAHSRLVSH